MARFNEISIEKRAQIVILRQTNLSYRKIAGMIGVSIKGVHTVLKRYAETQSNADRKRSGRPRKTTRRDDTFIQTTSKRDRFKTAPDIRAEANAFLPQPISITTVRRRLKEAGLNGRVAKRKPLLRAVNKQKHLEFAKKHRNWTIDQ